jgi:uncharacterized membrane-anchored protein YhcB (DUF1043 family)
MSIEGGFLDFIIKIGIFVIGVVGGVVGKIAYDKYATAHKNQRDLAEMKGNLEQRYNYCDKNFNELNSRVEKLEEKYEFLRVSVERIEVSIKYFEKFMEKLEKGK